MSEIQLSPAEEKRNLVMCDTALAAAYQSKDNIKEVWVDNKSNALCLRINSIFYDIITHDSNGGLVVLKEGLSSKPSALSVVLGRVVEGDAGEGVFKFDWEKLSEDIKTPSQRNLMTGDYKSADGLLQIKWSNDLNLKISSHQLDGHPIFVDVTHGAFDAEKCKVLKSAVDAWILRCGKKLNPQEPKQRKPRAPKVALPAGPDTPKTDAAKPTAPTA